MNHRRMGRLHVGASITVAHFRKFDANEWSRHFRVIFLAKKTLNAEQKMKYLDKIFIDFSSFYSTPVCFIGEPKNGEEWALSRFILRVDVSDCPEPSDLHYRLMCAFISLGKQKTRVDWLRGEFLRQKPQIIFGPTHELLLQTECERYLGRLRMPVLARSWKDFGDNYFYNRLQDRPATCDLDYENFIKWSKTALPVVTPQRALGCSEWSCELESHSLNDVPFGAQSWARAFVVWRTEYEVGLLTLRRTRHRWCVWAYVDGEMYAHIYNQLEPDMEVDAEETGLYFDPDRSADGWRPILMRVTHVNHLHAKVANKKIMALLTLDGPQNEHGLIIDLLRSNEVFAYLTVDTHPSSHQVVARYPSVSMSVGEMAQVDNAMFLTLTEYSQGRFEPHRDDDHYKVVIPYGYAKGPEIGFSFFTNYSWTMLAVVKALADHGDPDLISYTTFRNAFCQEKGLLHVPNKRQLEGPYLDKVLGWLRARTRDKKDLTRWSDARSLGVTSLSGHLVKAIISSALFNNDISWFLHRARDNMLTYARRCCPSSWKNEHSRRPWTQGEDIERRYKGIWHSAFDYELAIDFACVIAERLGMSEEIIPITERCRRILLSDGLSSNFVNFELEDLFARL